MSPVKSAERTVKILETLAASPGRLTLSQLQERTGYPRSSLHALVRTLRVHGYFANRPEPDLMSLLDLVALGTVADVAQIRGLNRAFVAQGLKVMARRANVGMAALIDVSRLKRAPACRLEFE